MCLVAMNTTAGRGWTRWAARIKPATAANQPLRGDDDDDDDCDGDDDVLSIYTTNITN